MSYYSINGVSIIYPSGTILSYLGVGDPAGWLICDGGARTATIPNEFAALAPILNTAMGTGMNNANYVVTPILTNVFLQGRSNASSGSSNGGGSAAHTLSTNDMPAHTHIITASGITTSITASSLTTSISGSGFATVTNNWEGGGSASGAYVGYTTSLSAATTASFSASTTIATLSASSTGSGTSFSILPPYFTVNYIIKI